MPISASELSRFYNTSVVVKDGIETFGLWGRPKFLVKENLDENQIIKVSINSLMAGRPDIIAQRFYGTALLEWVVVMFNRPLNTLGWPQLGTVIEIPIKEVVSGGL